MYQKASLVFLHNLKILIMIESTQKKLAKKIGISEERIEAVIKDCDKADKNESIESLKASDLYIACRENRARFDQFKYDYNFFVDKRWERILP